MKIRKKIYAFITILAMTVVMFAQADTVSAKAASNGPVSYYGQLQASGNRIIGENTGRPAQVKGMSFFWSQWSTKYWNASTVDRMVDEFQCEIVRCAYGVTDWGTPHNSSDEARLREVVEEAIARDIYVIIDWHSHGAHLSVDSAKDFFTRMARDYGSYDNVIFEVFNEPMNVDWGTVKHYAEQIIPCIRKYSDNLIVVGTPNWDQDVDIAVDNPINDSNLAYTLHFYAGSHQKSYRDKADYALSKNKALFVTEWGSVNADGNGGIAYGYTEEWLNWMNENQLSWCNWAINDKDETSSIFYSDGSLREAGNYLKSILNGSAPYAEWRGAGSNNNNNNSTNNNNNNGSNAGISFTIEAEKYSYMSGVEAAGDCVGYIDPGDWMSYEVDVETAGTYTVDFYVASAQGSSFNLEKNAGTEVLTSVFVPNTGDWCAYTVVSKEVYLTAGMNNIAIGTNQGGFNIDKMVFTKR